MKPNAKEKISELIRESKRVSSVAHVKLMTDQSPDDIHALIMQARNNLNSAMLILVQTQKGS